MTTIQLLRRTEETRQKISMAADSMLRNPPAERNEALMILLDAVGDLAHTVETHLKNHRLIHQD